MGPGNRCIGVVGKLGLVVCTRMLAASPWQSKVARWNAETGAGGATCKKEAGEGGGWRGY